MVIINESAIYKLILCSNKPNELYFQNFVFGEILPSIRKKGEYKLDNKIKIIFNKCFIFVMK